MNDSAPRIQKAQRWLDVIAYLVGRRIPATVDEIMEAVPAYAGRWGSENARDRDTVRRMFERDKDELREAGIPIQSEDYWVNHGATRLDGYSLRKKNFQLPYLRIVAEAQGGTTPESGDPAPRGARTIELHARESRTAFRALESVAELPGFPLRQEARSTWRKLSFDLAPPPDRPAVLYADRAGSEEVTTRTRVLTDALADRKLVSFTYHGIYRGTPTNRRVRPYGLLFQLGHWYLIGHDEAREELRVFRLDRMEDLVPNSSSPHTPDFEIPEDFTLDAFRDRRAWELGSSDDDQLVARVQFEFPRSLWAERRGYGRFVLHGDDGGSVREFEVRQVDPFLRWILSLRGEARIAGPPELVKRLDGLAREALAAYEPEAGEDG
ncbi:MAG: WYL domain-containing protein [marine benthic group bacterium]|jgi:proteasome accessory factor B|nr:WYL domain-containing protein [Gemmatimonadota bacterium]MCL7982535.1 WYL domain-containing protein [Gemmatimonadota bacterium]MCL7985448.1 WYL domain-containing protein [Gemmatimonadota bacterium]